MKPFDHPSVRHHCGLFGIFGHEDAAALTHLGLFAQQHRGQESAGICSTDGTTMLRVAGVGLVNDVFDRDNLDKLRNPIAIGHVRYSTTGSCDVANAQPLLFDYAGEPGAPASVAHNGNLVNATALRREFELRGHVFQTTSDTEVLIHLLADPANKSAPDPLVHALRRLQGAYCLLILQPGRLLAIRDPLGFRPLCIGRMINGAYVVASETCALDIVNADYLRDVEPGEIVTISSAGLACRRFGDERSGRGAACIFEHVYFADPSSNVFGENVHLVRKRMGEALAREAPVDADFVIPIPNCARCAALGYSRQSGIELGRGFTTSHYVGRSFIMPDQSLRDRQVRMKLHVIKDAVRGKRLIVVEDSVVRGTTTRAKLGALRDAGATEIHLRVASPPIRHGCYFGIDFPDKSKLVATDRNVEQIREFLGVDSLHFLSVESMLDCVKLPRASYCTACFTGDYPVHVDEPVDKFAMEKRLPILS